MVERYVMSIDQGTNSTRCILFDHQGRLVSVAQKEHRQYFPKPGWVEHDAVEIWQNLRRVVPEALSAAGVEADQIAAVGLANQRETTVVWDRRTGAPLGRAIVWQDTRTAPLVEELRQRPGEDFFLDRCGLPPPPTSPHCVCAGSSTTSRVWNSARRTARCCAAPWRAG